MRRLAIVLASMIVVVSWENATIESAKAWGHGCFTHHHSVAPRWGAYGMGGGFPGTSFVGCGLGGFSTRFNSIGSCYRSSWYAVNPRCLSYRPAFFGCAPQYYSCSSFSFDPFCANYYSTFACYPSFYGTSFYIPPAYYRPIVIPSVRIIHPLPRPIIAPILLPPLCATNSAPKASSKDAWLASATELIDLMVQRGGVAEGLEACEQLMRVRDRLPSELYWRAAILAAAANRDAKEIVAMVERAEAAEGRLAVEQLPGGSLRGYLRGAQNASLDQALDRLATAAMQRSNPTAEYRALSNLLALDGQTDRARLFQMAAAKAAPVDKKEVQSITSLASRETTR